MAQIDLITGAVEYPHADVSGSVVASTGSDEFLSGTVNYGAYSKREGVGVSRFGFAGEWTDPVTGYVFLRTRWHDPTTVTTVGFSPGEANPS